MKKIFKVVAVLVLAMGMTMMSVSCTKEVKANENFNYVLEYFEENIIKKDQQLVHCDITNNKEGYLLTYSYKSKDATYVVVITFDENCEITRYDTYGDGMYVNEAAE